jgi:hypothetical protein
MRPPRSVACVDPVCRVQHCCAVFQANFDQDKQLKFRAALAASAGTTAENVEITSITEGRRRQGQGIKVENKVKRKMADSGESAFASCLVLMICPMCHSRSTQRTQPAQKSCRRRWGQAAAPWTRSTPSCRSKDWRNPLD